MQPYGQLAAWYFHAADLWPDTFDFRELSHFWNKLVCDVDHNNDGEIELGHRLKCVLLRILRRSVSGCERCDLSANRLASRPVLDDGSYDADIVHHLWPGNYGPPEPIGPVDAKIMVIGEGPGQYEQRTGQPFVSYNVLAGSFCALNCGRYEECYVGSPIPRRSCEPVSLRRQIYRETGDREGLEEAVFSKQCERANLASWRTHIAGNLLDRALIKAGLWRESWNGRGSRRVVDGKLSPLTKPGSVYITNLVKCRSCVPNEKDKVDGVEDRTPKQHQIEACRPWLDAQIYIIRPRVLVALGAPAATLLTGFSDIKITQDRGKLCTSIYGLPVLLDVHPAYILRQGNRQEEARLIEGLTQTFLRAKRIASGEESVEDMTEEPVHPESAEPMCPTALPGFKFTPTFPKEYANDG